MFIVPPDNFRHYSDIFRRFSDIFVDILFFWDVQRFAHYNRQMDSEGVTGVRSLCGVGGTRGVPKNCTEIRKNQEPRKGGFSGGGFLENPASRPRKNTNSQRYFGPSSRFSTQNAIAKRGVHSCKNPLPKNPHFFLVPEKSQKWTSGFGKSGFERRLQLSNYRSGALRLSGTEEQPKESVLGEISCGRPGGCPGPKTLGAQENKYLFRGRPFPEGADVHDRQACLRKLCRRNIGLVFQEREREPKTRIFEENRRFSQIHPFLLEIQALGERRQNRRKPQIFAENRRKPQIGVRHLRSVTSSSALVFVP